ncbi:Chaperone protein HtpG [bioreactor metagenome]|uniref:Chaperone protein HtpG n=1 Tax=bioreactor metagenome TaxID=1076179 RepID=A0A644WNE1_9ZZZZ
MQKGSINVQTGNIFPIIKKFLYSEHEIFLRELVSNAVDATTKLKKLVSLGKTEVDLGDLTIQIDLDTKKKTLKISDRGIGMTEEEVQKYINEIAFSGAEDFVKKYIGKDDKEISGIIGHFGLGFYSSFMVAEKVEINTLSYQEGAKAVKWTCDGSPEYTMTDSKKNGRGTEITLHLAEDSIEFNDEHRILEMLKKFCRFLPYPVQFGTEKVSEPVEGEKDKDGNQKYEETEKPRIINNTDPLWKKAPADLKDEDYKNFYRELYPYSYEEPLFNIHINVDYPFNLTGILYFPKLKKNLEVQRNKIQLYCNQVFVTDNVENIVPDFLTLLHGVIDSPDIPLNVSRSYLQGDPNVKKISSHITKKVADKLEELYKNSREDFEKKWDDIRVFIRYGMITTDSFAERAEKFALLKDTEGKYFTLDEYKENIKDAQTDKDEKLVILYTTDTEEQHTYISAAQAKGYSVLELDSVIDIHFIDFLERKNEKISFKRVDAELADKLIDKNVDKIISKLNEEESKKVEELFKESIPSDVHVFVQVEAAAEDAAPVSMMQPEFMRRMSDMSQLGGMDYMAGMGRSYTLLVNSNHPVVTGLVDSTDEEKNKNIVNQLIDLALLSQGLLKGEKLSKFINRSIDIIK